MTIRQPIITVAGHVDHGKTSILDSVRGTKIQEGEAGGITQKISFTELPGDVIKERAGEILKKLKIDLEIPGFLFIDTPGHAAFTNLRKRGGSLADLAVVVIDINDGIKPQTSEVLQILKANKTPFIIALNKIDNISGWHASDSGFVFESLEQQAVHVKQNFEEKFYTLVGALNSYGFNAELYFKVEDFTNTIAVVPTSAETGEGVAEVIAVLAALSQKFLKDRIAVGEKGKGVVLEVKKDKSINYLESILYDGSLTDKDEIVIASFDEPIVTKVRNIQKALPLNRGFEVVEEVGAAAGLRLQVTTKDEVLPGMGFRVFKNEVELEEIKKEFSEEIGEEIRTDKNGIVVKADSLGSLEAVLTLLRQNQVRVFKVGIGPITKKDVYLANSLPEENRVIIGFNSEVAEDVDVEELDNVRIFSDPVVYKLIEDYQEWKQEKLKELERGRLEDLSSVCKVRVLDFVFRNSNPAIFGVAVEGGKLVPGVGLIDVAGKKVGKVKVIQEDKTKLREAGVGKEVAISVPGVNFERQIEVGQVMFSNLAESQFRKFKANKDLLTQDEKKVLQEIAEVKRKTEITWGV